MSQHSPWLAIALTFLALESGAIGSESKTFGSTSDLREIPV